MIKEFEGKVAIITGGGSGIGRSMSRTFAKRGMKIVLADVDPLFTKFLFSYILSYKLVNVKLT